MHPFPQTKQDATQCVFFKHNLTGQISELSFSSIGGHTKVKAQSFLFIPSWGEN